MTATATVGYDMTVDGVTFRYGPHAEPVLRDLDLSIPDGDHLAVVGPSGIGKSTLAGLLCGLLQPDEGTVRLGSATAAELHPCRLAELRTLIPQEAYVFAGTAWDNLTYLRPDATTRQFRNVVAAVGAEALLRRLGGLSAQLQPAALSAGQRQLVALVRAYLSAAPVIVLDEATCHLDPAAERRAEQAFAHRGGTLVVVAHRVSSALRARRILVLDGVRAVVGDHATLLSTSPLYRELLGHWNGRPTGTRHAPVDHRLHLTNGEAMSHAMDNETEPAAGPRPDPVQPASPMRSGLWRRHSRRVPPTTPATEVAPEPPASDLAERFAPAEQPEPAQPDQRPQPLIFGRVTEDGSAPLPGATMTLTDLSGRQLSRDSCDVEGHYRLETPEAGGYLVVCASVSHQPTAALVVVDDRAVRHDVALSGAGATLSGTVCSAGSGQPIGDATVTLVDVRGDVAATTRTAADGCFDFAAVAQGHYTLTAAAASLRPVARSVDIPASGHVSHDLEVQTRLQLRGVVRTATTAVPVAEALATVIASDGRVVGSVVTGADGEFVFDDLDAGTYTVVASGYPPVAAEVHLDAATPAETVITLRPATPERAAAVDNGAVGGAGAADDGHVDG